MKKIVGTIAAIALATSAVFADVNVGMGFSRGIFTPIASDGKDTRMDISTSWGAAPRIGGSISGASDECGVVGDFRFDAGTLETNDNAYIWVKPISWLKLNIGQSFDDTLRGNACFGSWDWLRFGNLALDLSDPDNVTYATAGTPDNAKFSTVGILTGEDFIFTRICGNPLGGAYAPLVGAILMADPIEGLHIGVGLNIPGYANQTTEDVFKTIQIQAGYTIDGIGQIKAQYIGAKGNGTPDDPKEKDWAQIEAAFCLKAVENMTLDVGAKFRTYKDAPIDVAVYWAMPFDALKVNASVGLTLTPKAFGGDDSSTAVVVGVGLDYDLGNGLAVGGDVRFGKLFCGADGFDDSAASDPAFGFGVYLNKGIANGTLGIGAEGALKAQIRDFQPSEWDKFTFAIPVRVQCFF